MAVKLVLDGVSAEEPRPKETVDTTDSLLAQLERLTPEEKAQTEQFADKIDLHKTEIVTNYGSTIQKQSASIASKTLESVRSSGTGEISDLLVRLVSAIDAMEGGSRGTAFADFFRNRPASDETENAEAVLEQIEKQLVRHQLVLQKDIVLLDALYEENWDTYKALTMYIRAGELALENARNGELLQLSRRAEVSGSPEDEMRADVFSNMCDQFESQIHNLRLTRAVCLQSAPQIKMLQQNDREMLSKLQSSIVNTLPLWRQKIAMSITMKNNEGAANASKAMDSLTNKMLRDHAAPFRRSVAASAKEAQRVTIDPETIEFVNREISGAVSDYIAIEKKGVEDRRSAASILSDSKRRLSPQ